MGADSVKAFLVMNVRWLSGMVALLALGCSSSEDSGDQGSSGDGGTPKIILDGGGTIPDAPNGPEYCQKGDCNYQKQDCADAGSCLPTDKPPASGDWPPQCFASGTKIGGQSCSAWNDCVAGYFCLGISGTTDGGVVPGVCRKLCCGGDWSACGTNESCIQQVYLLAPGGTDPVYARADVCAPVNDCDVLSPNSCSEKPAKSCQIVDPKGNVACMPAGTAGVGEPCDTNKPCKGGFFCVDKACRRLCRAVEGGGEPSCPASEGICVHFARDPVGVGECTEI